ncbi:MAG: hypothetical protein HZB76_03375 [Chlamydiae bacterium]|nr:hypothetical protein [Chlamydiota bacterium]
MKKYFFAFSLFLFVNLLAKDEPDFTIKYLTFEEIKRYDLLVSMGPYYYLITSNFPMDKILNLKTKNLDEHEKDMGKIQVCKNGTIKLVKKPNHKKILSAKYLQKGEPLEFIFESEGKTFECKKTFVLKPLEVRLDNGKTFSLKLASPNGKMYNMSITGFSPHEKVIFTSKSCDEELTNLIELLDDGTIVANVLPGVIGQTGGDAYLQIKTLKNEVLRLDYKWGDKLVP